MIEQRVLSDMGVYKVDRKGKIDEYVWVGSDLVSVQVCCEVLYLVLVQVLLGQVVSYG